MRKMNPFPVLNGGLCPLSAFLPFHFSLLPRAAFRRHSHLQRRSQHPWPSTSGCGAVGEQMGVSYELIFVNDGSRDRSLELLRTLAAQHPQVRYIDFSRNFGHQIAVTAGLDLSRGEAVAIIDADLQDPPELPAGSLPEAARGLRGCVRQAPHPPGRECRQEVHG